MNDESKETEIWVLLNEADTALDLEAKVECLLQVIKHIVRSGACLEKQNKETER